ncbi:MAG: YebC/PmpR family DNA-binding regulatory protein [Salibacteraceae bacterium]|jgi:YebC/PmpR family DNA-binding regulatory protein
MGRAFELRKGRKLKRWSKMAKTFSRIGKDIVMAIKEGGPEVESNARLRAVIQNAKAANMPKEIVDRAIKKAKDKDTSDYKEVNFEGYGPHGVAVMIETATDNNNRTVASVRSIFSKNGGNMGTTGSVDFMFERKCHFKIPMKELDPEELEFELIDAGIDELFGEEPEEDAEDQTSTIMIYGPFESFGSIQKALEEKELEILESGYERIPTTTAKLSEEHEAEVDKLLEKLDEDEDIMNVYHTMG